MIANVRVILTQASMMVRLSVSLYVVLFFMPAQTLHIISVLFSEIIRLYLSLHAAVF